MSLLQHDARDEAFDFTSHFREDVYTCLTRRGDTLFELCDAMLCEDGPVTLPVDLTLPAEHRRGHGALYDALNHGRIDVARLRKALAVLPQPKAADGRLVLAVDVSAWLRPDAPTSPDRLFCHVYGRSGRSSDQLIPGWPYSFVAALETGRTSWCQLLDAVRLGPDDDVAEVTAAQVRRVVTDLIDQGQWEAGDDDILIVFDAGYDAPRMAHLLDGMPIEVLGRMRADRVMRRPMPTLKEYALAYPQGGRPPKHGKEFRFARPETWGEPDAEAVQVTDRYGTAQAMAWDRIHPRLTTRPWEKPAEPARLTPARVRRGFRNLRPHLHNPARAPKPATPGPGRPLGSKNQRPATRYDVGKSTRRPESIAKRNQLKARKP
ncbi:DDE superfamily endonuclease [Streptomyces sp. ScaeMP-e48]|uniref:transposase n=1 Tax=Streptomyces TaxID=1883 RepID=UPI000823A8A4|nr:transposase [Streptomyces sp. ScaeMP-e48]SCK34194.1 DDE superfamily endonuclease [Streptomyces sp. ScaeMP-e48]